MRKFLAIAAGTALLTAIAVAQTAPSAAGNNWTYNLGDQAGTRFSTLTQITTANVARLKRAWTFHTGSGRFAGSPMVIDGVMYFSAPNGVFAVDAVTGQQIWKYVPEIGSDSGGPGGGGGGGLGRGTVNSAGTALRGPLYWPGNATVGPRIYSTTTPGLAAIDAKTGALARGFGDNGVLYGIRPDSPAVFYKNLLIGSGGVEPGKGETVKGWDVVTGRPVWTFYLKAQPGDPNRATWLNGSAESDATPGIWGVFTVDEERGTVFFPVEKVGNDYWGGSNHGSNLYSDSIVALDALTGKMKWFRQLVHHDIWDYDIAAPPALIEVRRNGRVIPAVVQQTKMALLFIFNRETGEPIFGVEERPVPQTTAPGEWTSPTQPFPVKPPPLSRNTLTRAQLAKVTPEHQAFCEGLWDKYKLSDAVPYQPWKVNDDVLVFPGAQGGGNWHGVAFNRPLGLIIAPVMDAGQWGHLEPAGAGRGGGRGGNADGGRGGNADGGRGGNADGGRGGNADGGRDGGRPGTADANRNAPPAMNKRTPEGQRFWDPAKRWSCSEPPWGELVAVDANSGDIKWHVPLGAFPELAAKGIKSGTPVSGGAITTAGNLVFIAASIDGMFRAFDARDGKELWSDKLPAAGHGTPTTYMGRDGKQYVVIGANGGGYFGSPPSDEVIAYTLQ